GTDGELKSTSKAMPVAPASKSLSINFAWSCRGQGQTPIASMEGESIATMTTSPLACLGQVLKRRSRSAFFNASGAPVSDIATKAHTTKRCGRILFPPPHRMASQSRLQPAQDVLQFAFRLALSERNADRIAVAISEPQCEAVAIGISEPEREAVAAAVPISEP